MTTASAELMRRMFAPWRNTPAGNAFPARAALATALNASYPLTGTVKRADIFVDIGVAKLFATAAVEIWHRAIHSLLISAQISNESPIWASIAGYYSSHYTLRGLAHVLGSFQSFQRKCSIQLSIDNGRYVCTYVKGYGREHEWYRSVLDQSDVFKSEPFFIKPLVPVGIGDIAHRDRANYWDHLPIYPLLADVRRDDVRNKLRSISKIELQEPPELAPERVPDGDAVQLIAYQRVARFRRFMDETL